MTPRFHGAAANSAVADAIATVAHTQAHCSPIRRTTSPASAPAMPAAPMTIHSNDERVASAPPTVAIRSRPKVHTATLPTPVSKDASSKPKVPVRQSGSTRFAVRCELAGTARNTQTVTAAETNAYTTHAARQWLSSSSAIGADSTTPIPVPPLTTVWARSAVFAGTCWATAAASGGETMPVLQPATSTPTASTQAEGASAMMEIPSVATTPAATATRRGPMRSVSSRLAVIAAQ